MANNRKPKLAPGSRWLNERIIDRERCLIFLAANQAGDKYIQVEECVDGQLSLFTNDALAAIRAAKLDPVFDSAVALAEYWDGSVLVRAYLEAEAPELCALLSANGAAVKGATSDE